MVCCLELNRLVTWSLLILAYGMGKVDKANSGKAECDNLLLCELSIFIVSNGLTGLDGVSGISGGGGVEKG